MRVNEFWMEVTKIEMTLEYEGDVPDEVTRRMIQPKQIADVLVQLLQQGTGGRTGQTLGMWLGRPILVDDSTAVGRRLDDRMVRPRRGL
ncbi:MAG: hypothetical protein ACJAR2_001758 [Ilumatobacter sp.]|jgi:hypothetical protein